MEDNKELPSRRRFSRRTFLKGALGGAVLMSGLLGRSSTSRKETQENIEPSLEKEIEARFDVDLMTLNQHLSSVGETPYSEESVTKLEWTTKRLNLLTHVLEVLPADFYKRSRIGEKLRITLTDFRGTCCGQFETHGYEHHVALAASLFDPENSLRALQHAAHEFTHLKEPKTQIPSERSMELASLDPERSDWSPWFDEIDEILGGRFYDINDNFYEKIDYKRQKLLDSLGIKDRFKLPENLDNKSKAWLAFYDRFAYGASGVAPSEFISVMSEYYLGGRGEFLTRYREFFSEEVTNGLYSFMRDRVFNGREYQEFPELH